MTKLRLTRQPLSLIEKIGIGMVLGLVGPFVMPLLGGSLPPFRREHIRLVVLFGPVFGGAMAYFLHRYRKVQDRVGTYWGTVFAGGLAGGATAALAFDLGYLTALWQVGAAVVAGAALIGLLWHM